MALQHGTQRITNTFQNGMVMDVDKHRQPPGTYRYALNGRIMFNTNGDLPMADRFQAGTTFSFVNEKGNKELFTVCNGYILCGSVDVENECITFWTNGTYSEIRSFKLDDLGNVFDQYTLFNDQWDPNGDKLNFNPAYYSQGFCEIENVYTIRVYFWDNRNWNQPRAINIALFYREYTDHADGEKIKTLPWHWNWDITVPNDPQPTGYLACGEAAVYPHWMSVHSFDWTTDVVFPRIKFFRRLIDSLTSNPPSINNSADYPVNKRCSLKTGIFQYFTRFVTKDGYTTPISPITDHIFLSSKYKDKNNHHNYTMAASNITTEFGIELIIDGVDTRYFAMEVGYMYSIGKQEVNEINIFKRVELTPGITLLNIEHLNHSGTPMSRDEVTRRFETIMGINAGGTKESKAYIGGITTLPEIKFDTEILRIKPFMRLMKGDQGDQQTDPVEYETPMWADTQADGYQVGDVIGNKPIPATNTQIVSKTLTVSAFTGENIEHEIVKDYENYKGMQFEHLFKGVWRGEVYGVAGVVLDRKGNHVFAQHFDDFKFPEQYENGDDNTGVVAGGAGPFNLTRHNADTGEYELKIMGMMISGLRIPKDVMYDKFGKLNIGGFKIVRNPRKPRILHQGLLLNTVHEQDCKRDKDPDYEEDITRPLPWLSNWFNEFFYPQYSNMYKYRGRCAKRDKQCKVDSLVIVNRPHTFTYESPDLFVTGETVIAQDTDYLKLVGTCHMGFLNDAIELVGNSEQFYTKSYRTDNKTLRYPMGSESRLVDVMKLNHRETRDKYDRDNTSLKFANDIWGIYIPETVLGGIEIEDLLHFPSKDCEVDPDPPAPPYEEGVDCFPLVGDEEKYYFADDTGTIYTWDGAAYVEYEITYGSWNPAKYASGHKDTTVVKCKDFMHMDVTDDPDNPVSQSSYHIVNYLRPNPAYYNSEDQKSLEIREYISTGHYQPINAAVLAKAKKVMKDGTVKLAGEVVLDEDIVQYQFDDIEVWGGDCFLQFIDYTRLLPYYTGACERCDGSLLDFSASMIIPLESNYNLMMRYGRSFAKCGTQSQSVSCDGNMLHFRDGIMDNQPEDWNVNEVMQHQNNLEVYASKPADIRITDDMPARVYYSLKKTYGELQDRYRKVLRTNYYDLEGAHGDIIGFVNNFSNIYCFQENAFGALRINQRESVPTEMDGKLQIGEGGDLDGVEYISTIFGCQHRESIMRMNNAIYWVSGRMGKFCRFAQDGNSLISDAMNMHDIATLSLPYFENQKFADNKVVKIVGARDYTNNEVIYTFYHNDSDILSSFTIVLNESINKYVMFYSFTPRLYIHHKAFYLSPDPAAQNKVYIYGRGKRGHFFGVYQKTILKYIVCPHPSLTSVFDNSLINVNKTGTVRIGQVKHKTQNQEHTLNLKTDTRAKYKEDKLRYPIRNNAYQVDRVRGHYMEVTLEINNGDQATDNLDTEVVITSIDTEFRISHKV